MEPTGVTGRHALLHVSISPDAPFTAAVVPFVETVVAADEADGFRVVPVGSASVTAAFNELAEETLVEGERIGLPVALTVLVLVFGALVAALVPIGLALASIAAALGLTFAVGQVTELDLFVVNMIAMIGLAVGIDHALFVVQRFREERGRGRTVADAVVVAADTAARAVLFSGVTVVIALLGLLLVPETTMRSLGVGAILAVLASVAAATTLLPAVLRLLGDRVDRLRVPFTTADQRDGHRFWTRITSVVTARPMVSAVLAGGVLIVLSVPYLSIALGSNFLGSLPPDADVRHGFALLASEFGGGITRIGFQQTDVIESWVPLFLFAVLFGLSMDYHVFLLSRIKEHYDRTHDNTASVRFGLASTGAIITGAALIMVGVFGGFGAGDLVMFQQMGFGLAVSVVLDAALVRTVLVPSTMELLGDRNWYLPAWLSWLPAFEVEATSPQIEDPSRSDTGSGRTTDGRARAHGVRTEDRPAVV